MKEELFKRFEVSVVVVLEAHRELGFIGIIPTSLHALARRGNKGRAYLLPTGL